MKGRLALAISNEEDDSRIYQGFAEGLRAAFQVAIGGVLVFLAGILMGSA